MTDEGDILDDVQQSTSDGSWPEAEAEALMRKRLRLNRPEHTFNQEDFKNKFKPPRRLDIGSGQIRDAGWIAVDIDSRTCPDLVMDAHSLQMDDDCVNEARMVFALSTFSSPARALKEAWRVLIPGGELTIIEHAPFSDASARPGIKNHFSSIFWAAVTHDNSADFVPARSCGRWELVSVTNELHHMTEKICQKLKLTRDQAVEFFSLIKKQTVKLRKLRI